LFKTLLRLEHRGGPSGMGLPWVSQKPRINPWGMLQARAKR
jgi:hypothetical protein